MSYPKWRHHPTKESMVIDTHEQEAGWCPDSDGWRDDRNFDAKPEVDEPKPKNKGGRPRKVQE